MPVYDQEWCDELAKAVGSGSTEHEPMRLLYVVTDTDEGKVCLLYTSPSPRDGLLSRMPSSA